MTVEVLIIDDHPLYRDALVAVLRRDFPESRLATAISAEEGMRLASELTGLRLVLLDLMLPGASGAEAIGKFRHACPNAALIAVSSSEERHDVTAAFRAGAIAFVSKSASAELLADVVRRALAGEIQEPQSIGASDATVHAAPLPGLTPRQKDILLLLSQGHSNKEIGLRLDLAEATVKMHISAVFRILGVVNRTQAVLAARRLALHDGGDDTAS